MSVKRPRSPSPEVDLKPPRAAPGVPMTQLLPVPSPSIIDRQSRFIAYYHPTLSPARLLKSLDAVASADHKITAWRTPRIPVAGAGPKPIFDTGSSDDGEKHAGRKVLAILEDLDATGTLVVARWWGGIMLGPARFDHIARCAREAVGAYRERSAEGERMREEARRKRELIAELEERDRSVVALRGLLDRRRGIEAGPAAAAAAAGAPAYGDMQTWRLEALSKARDGTIAFLLAKLDETDVGAEGGGDGTIVRAEARLGNG